MYKNIGKKIKSLSAAIGYGGIIVSIIGGIIFTVKLNDSLFEDFSFIGIVIGLISAFWCWIIQFIVYGFGELVDNTMQINSKLEQTAKSTHSTQAFISNKAYSPPTIQKDIDEKITYLNQWLEKGLIDEAEYAEKINALKDDNK